MKERNQKSEPAAADRTLIIDPKESILLSEPILPVAYRKAFFMPETYPACECCQNTTTFD